LFVQNTLKLEIHFLENGNSENLSSRLLKSNKSTIFAQLL